MWSSDQIPMSPGVIRPSRVTARGLDEDQARPRRRPGSRGGRGASRWPSPPSAQYWHIGETTIRFRNVTPSIVSGLRRSTSGSVRFGSTTAGQPSRTSRAGVGSARLHSLILRLRSDRPGTVPDGPAENLAGRPAIPPIIGASQPEGNPRAPGIAGSNGQGRPDRAAPRPVIRPIGQSRASCRSEASASAASLGTGRSACSHRRASSGRKASRAWR